jgi:hypothetical protein
MTGTAHKITDTMAGRASAARHLMTAKVVPYAVPMSRKMTRQASEQAAKQMQQAKVLMQEKLVPMASSAMDNAMVASGPARAEAIRRAKLAAAVLRGDDAMLITKAPTRKWMLAVAFLTIGGVIGAAIAWLSQAGRPVQLSPYPLTSDSDAPQSVDLSAEERHPHHQS